MIKDKDNSSSDSVYEQQQDEMEAETNLQRSFMDLCLEQKHHPTADTLYTMDLPREKEMMFILFSYYQDDLTAIGLEHSCKVRLSLNKIRIVSDTSRDDVDACRQKIQQYLEKLSYTQLNHQNKFKILYSPYFKEKAQLMGFRLCKFNSLIYCHSNKMTENELKSNMKELFLGQYLFTVDIKSRKSKEREIYNYFRDFIRKMKEYYSEDFKSRNVVVELDNSDTKINCIGVRQRDLVAVKNTMKNLLESTVIFIVKFQSEEGIDKRVQELKTFIKKKSSFPATVAKIEKRAMTIITKENVLRKLLQVPKMFQLLKLNQKTELGMFLPRRLNYMRSKILIQQICTKRGYDFTTLGSVYHYFKKMFIHDDDQDDPKVILLIIHDILEAIKENKERYDVPEQIREGRRKNRDLQVTEGEYYTSGEVQQDMEISNMLKRSVLKEKLKMSKPFLVKYRICDAPQSERFYWYEDAQKNKVKCEVKDMKMGIEYFCGKVKKLGSEEYYLIQSKIVIT